MAAYGHSMLVALLILLLVKSDSNHDECHESSCGLYEPFIKFPFQLVQENQDRCTNPTFCIYCTENKKTMILLHTTSGPMEFLVQYINYTSQQVDVSDPENCLPEKFLKLRNSSFLPYQFDSISQTKTVFFNCSSLGRRHLRNNDQIFQESQNMISCPIYTSSTFDSVLRLDLVSCTKMFEIDAALGYYNWMTLRWQGPNCTECKVKGEKCRWKNNSTKSEIECLNCHRKRKTFHIPKSLIFTATSSIILGLVSISIFKMYLHFREKEEDLSRVDKFLEDYRAQKATRFSYADIKRITKGFKEKLGEGTHGTIFKGKLSNEILVAVKMLNNTEVEGKDFINEVGIMGKIHHINVVRLLGFCAEGIHRVLVYNFFSNGSLQSFIFPPDKKDHFLGWEKLHQISLGIAKGIEYLHEGCNHPILHLDINPHNILLDDVNFTPKISDFGLAKLCSKNLSVISMTVARGTLGYMAPEVFSRNFGNVSLKSDIYSYGMLLLEMVGGKKNMDLSSAEIFQVLYPEWIHNLLEGDVYIHIENEGDVKIAKKLAIVGLWCIQWQPVNRPSIKSVVQMLETIEENHLPVPPNPFSSTTSTATRERTFTRQAFQMEVIRE